MVVVGRLVGTFEPARVMVVIAHPTSASARANTIAPSQPADTAAGKNGKGCPPGLAKKNNGCMPPGQAAKWQVGHPLPTTVVTYAVPHQVLVSLPPVPVGHKYVQVAGDILLIAVGSMMVVDGINGLSGR